MAIIANNNLYQDAAEGLISPATSGTYAGPLVESTVMLLTSGAVFGSNVSFAQLTSFEASFTGYSRSAISWGEPLFFQGNSYGLLASEIDWQPATSLTVAEQIVGYAVIDASDNVILQEQISPPAVLQQTNSILSVVLNINNGPNGWGGAAEIEN